MRQLYNRKLATIEEEPVTESTAGTTVTSATNEEQTIQPTSIPALAPITSSGDIYPSGSQAAYSPIPPQDLPQYVSQSPITSTVELVKAYNNELHDLEQKQALYAWIHAYIKWFTHSQAIVLDKGQMREYAYLAHIKPNSRQGQKLLYQYFISLVGKIKQQEFDEEPLINALEYTLQRIEPKTLSDRADKLSYVGECLLSKIKPTSTAFSKATYPKDEAILTAVHTILLLMRKLGKRGWADESVGLYNGFLEKISGIKAASRYYPAIYYSNLLEASLTTLQGLDMLIHVQRLDCPWQVVKTLVSIHQVARGLLGPEMDIAAWETAYQQFRDNYLQAQDRIDPILQVVRENATSRSWYSQLIDLTLKYMAMAEDNKSYKTFRASVQKLQVAYRRQRAERLALRYGIVKQLSLSALKDQNAEVREGSLDQLKALAKVWYKDAEIAESMLEGLGAIAKQGHCRKDKVVARAYLSHLESQICTAHASVPTTPPPSCCVPFYASASVSPSPECTNMPGAMRLWLSGQILEAKLGTTLPHMHPLERRLFIKFRTTLTAPANNSVAMTNEYSTDTQEEREYSALRSVARLFLSQHIDDQEKAVALLRTHMYVARYRESLALMIREIAKDASQRMCRGTESQPYVQKLLTWVSTPQEVVGFQHLLLQLRLLNEFLLATEREEAEQGAKIMNTLEADLQLGQKLSMWFNKGLQQYEGYERPGKALYHELVSLLGETSGVTQHYSYQLLSLMQNALQDSNAHVRKAALQAFKTLLPPLVQDIAPSAILSLIQQALEDATPAVRGVAGQALAQLIETSASVSAIFSLVQHCLQHSHGYVSKIAVESLPTLVDKGIEVSSVLPLIQHVLKSIISPEVMLLYAAPPRDSDYDVHRATLTTLLTLVEKGAPVADVFHLIQEALKDRTCHVHNIASEALRTLIEKSTTLTEITPLVQNALQDRDTYVRRAALKALAPLVDRGAEISVGLVAILSTLEDKDYNVRDMGLQTLGTLVERGLEVSVALCPVLKALEDRSCSVRSTALQVSVILIERGAEVSEVLPLILNALKDNNGSVRSTALQVIATLAEQGIDMASNFSHISHVLRDSDDYIRSRALQVLVSLVKKQADVPIVLPHILNALKDNACHVQLAASKSLQTLLANHVTVSEGCLLIQKLFKDSNAKVRRAVIQALSTLLEKWATPSAIFPYTQHALKDRDPSVRLAALEVLLASTEKGTSVSAVLPSVLQALDDQENNVRKAALHALPTLVTKGIATSAVVPDILHALEANDNTVRRAAIQALQALMDKGAGASVPLRTVDGMLQDHDRYVRRTSLEVLPTLVVKGMSLSAIFPHIQKASRDSDECIRH
ncbi:MAG: HEAT repeat domain-containing protein, partial [Bacteroidota bacterium]